MTLMMWEDMDTAREKGKQSKNGGHDTRARHSMPPCCRWLTWWGREGRYSVTWFYFYQSQNRPQSSLSVWLYFWDFGDSRCGEQMPRSQDFIQLIHCKIHWATGKMTEWAISPFLKHDWLAGSVSLCVFYLVWLPAPITYSSDGVQGRVSANAEVWARHIVGDSGGDHDHGHTELVIFPARR